MAQPSKSILVPYDDYSKLRGDSTKVELALNMLYASFADETCRMTALKSALGYVEPTPDPEPTPTPDPDPSNTTDPTNPEPTDPSTGG